MFFRKILGLLLFSIPLTLTQSQTCNVLSLTGGGSFGINEIAILQNLYDNSQVKNFDLITGVSAGGLNSGFLSYFPNLKEGLNEIKNIYFNLKDSDIYTNDALHILSTWSIYDTTPLKKTLNNTITRLESKGKSIIPTVIGSSNILKEELEIFHFNSYNPQDKVEILLATSAIPIAFPPVKLNNTIYNDGGLLSNEIILEAIPILDQLEKNCNDISFLIISAHRKNKEIPYSQIDSFWKYLQRIIGMLADNFNDEISKIMELCSTKRLSFKICYPTSPELEKYSILEFDNSKLLFNLTYHSYSCEERFC